MHFLYIIYSRSIGTYYVGETHDMDERLVKHNNHIYSKGFTKSANDWIVALKFECRSREDALYLERFVKRMKSKTFINRIIQKPSILEDLLSQK
jgi:putative endonuclease